MWLNCKVKKVATPYFYINTPFQGYPLFLAKNFEPPPPLKWVNFWKVLPPPPFNNGAGGGGGFQLWKGLTKL